jgi:DHA2 family multidrug resistance protein
MPRSLVMIVATPIVGLLYNRVSPRAFVAFGVCLFAFTAWQMSHYTLQTSTNGIVTALVLQGIAFSCLFVPLTTVALATIPRHRLTDATGLNSLLRQIGGSVGLALMATLLGRYQSTAKVAIASHLTAGRPEVAARLGAIARGVMARLDVGQQAANQAALRALNGMATLQAVVLAFEKLFLLAGILFLAVLPLLLFLKKPDDEPGPKVDVHVEI